MNFERRPLAAGLYLVATPIGNARDITLRALDVLASAEVIAAEDTRTARRLMEIHGVPLDGRRVLAYHDHSSPGARGRLVAAAAAGAVAYVSEAGSPLISDPGYALARDVAAAGANVTSVPGPVAAVAALGLSGLPCDRFLFAGFLPSAQAARRRALGELAGIAATLVFYESPRRVHDLFTDMSEILGEKREAAICRELTKLHEEVLRGTIGGLSDRIAEAPLRGEVVVLVGAPVDEGAATEDVEEALREALRSMRMKDAATAVAGALGLPRREVYQMALAMDRES